MNFDLMNDINILWNLAVNAPFHRWLCVPVGISIFGLLAIDQAIRIMPIWHRTAVAILATGSILSPVLHIEYLYSIGVMLIFINYAKIRIDRNSRWYKTILAMGKNSYTHLFDMRNGRTATGLEKMPAVDDLTDKQLLCYGLMGRRNAACVEWNKILDDVSEFMYHKDDFLKWKSRYVEHGARR